MANYVEGVVKRHVRVVLKTGAVRHVDDVIRTQQFNYSDLLSRIPPPGKHLTYLCTDCYVM
jgi:hypothetical protein